MLVIRRTYVCVGCFSCYNKYKVIAKKGVVSIIELDNNSRSVSIVARYAELSWTEIIMQVEISETKV